MTKNEPVGSTREDRPLGIRIGQTPTGQPVYVDQSWHLPLPLRLLEFGLSGHRNTHDVDPRGDIPCA